MKTYISPNLNCIQKFGITIDFYGQWQDTVLESMIIFNTTFIGEERLIGKISL